LNDAATDAATGFSWRQTPLTFALADANSFYASCEEVFRPALVGQPVIVLSNNDGCVIARSRAAKRLPGVAMGAPVHTLRRQIRAYGITVCSANFALYGDLSRRMLDVFSQYAADVDPYSIDEAFLDLTPIPDTEKATWAQRLRQAVYQTVGVWVSVGVAPTKTLAKIATDQAKEDPRGVCVLLDRRAQEEALARTPVEDIWGIGSRRAAYLRAHGVETAYEFAYATDPAWVKRHLYVPVARTQWELRGVACLPLETVPAPRQQILCAKSFGRPVRELSELKEALADYTARVAAKARAQGSLGATAVLWLATNGFRKDEPQYSQSITLHLPRPTAFVPDLLRSLYPALERLYRPGYNYHRVGVLLCDLVPETPQQGQLFAPPPDARDEEIMAAMTRINERFGRDTIRFLATGTTRPWQMQQTARSPRFTTRWSELAKAH